MTNCAQRRVGDLKVPTKKIYRVRNFFKQDPKRPKPGSKNVLGPKNTQGPKRPTFIKDGSLRRPSVVRPSSTFSMDFSSETTGPIAIKFHKQSPGKGRK